MNWVVDSIRNPFVWTLIFVLLTIVFLGIEGLAFIYRLVERKTLYRPRRSPWSQFSQEQTRKWASSLRIYFQQLCVLWDLWGGLASDSVFMYSTPLVIISYRGTHMPDNVNVTYRIWNCLKKQSHSILTRARLILSRANLIKLYALISGVRLTDRCFLGESSSGL